MSRQLISILTIAGSDCSGGAGIQADIRAAAMRNVYASTAVTALTVQNSHGMTGMFATEPDILASQLDCIFEDCRPGAIKIGMLGNMENGELVSDFIKHNAKDIPVVVDPVMKASAGGDLSSDSESMVEFYVNKLCPQATVVTPNLEEVKNFGCSKGDIKESARALLDRLRCMAVVVKGGHSEHDIIRDVLASRDNRGDVIFETVTSSRIDCNNLHGTGCVFSSLMAAELAKGNSISYSFHIASWLMKTIISESRGYKLGVSSYGPLNLFNYDLHNQR